MSHLVANRVLILSTSAHWADHKLNSSDYHKMTQQVLGYLKKRFKGHKVFIRGMSPGHPDCHSSIEPLKSSSSDILHPPNWYNWGDFEAHNKLWKASLKELDDDRFLYLDVESMTSLRADGHLKPFGGDCLHYCQPSIPDYWNFLLSSLLMSGLRHD